MRGIGRTSFLPAAFGLAAASLLLAGCQTLHDVKIDSINNPAKPLGVSYRLEMLDPTGSQADSVAAQAHASVRSALAARGMYETPPKAPADMVITAEYGVGPGQMKIVYRPGDPTLGGMGRSTPRPILVFEKYLKLTAREPAPENAGRDRRGRAPRGEELWSLQVSVEDEKRELPPYLPVLASASIDHIGANSGSEVHITVDAGTASETLKRRPAGSAR